MFTKKLNQKLLKEQYAVQRFKATLPALILWSLLFPLHACISHPQMNWIIFSSSNQTDQWSLISILRVPSIATSVQRAYQCTTRSPLHRSRLNVWNIRTGNISKVRVFVSENRSRGKRSTQLGMGSALSLPQWELVSVLRWGWLTKNSGLIYNRLTHSLRGTETQWGHRMELRCPHAGSTEEPEKCLPRKEQMSAAISEASLFHGISDGDEPIGGAFIPSFVPHMTMNYTIQYITIKMILLF